jgi:hypothetical protein
MLRHLRNCPTGIDKSGLNNNHARGFYPENTVTKAGLGYTLQQYLGDFSSFTDLCLSFAIFLLFVYRLLFLQNQLA